MKVRLQYRFLFKLLAAVVVVAVLVYGIHRWQVLRNSAHFLAQARRAAEAGEPNDAIRLYSQYLGLDSNSADAYAELGEILLGRGDFRRAFFNLENALRLDASLKSARQALVTAAMELERFADAKTHLAKELVPAEPDNAEYLWLLGRCDQELGEFDSALGHLERAVELDDRNPTYAASLAELLSQRLNRPAEARIVLDQLIAKAADDPAARLVRGRWLLDQSRLLTAGENTVRQGLVDIAWQDAQASSRLGLNSPQSVILLVDVAVASDRSAEAREPVRAAIKSHPAVPELYGSAAQIELRAEDREAAIQILKTGLKAVPGNPDLLFNLAQLELDADRIASGETLIAELRSRKFEEAPIRYLESRVLAAKRQWREAATLLEASRALFDRSKELLKQADYLLSVCYRNLGNPDQELEALRRAVSADPLGYVAREALAGALLRAGRIQESMSEFSQVILHPQTSASSVLSLARLMFIDGLGRNATGDDWNGMRQVLAQLDEIPEAANDLAIMRAELLVVEDQTGDAQALLKSQLEKDPKVATLHQALIALQIREKAWEDVEKSLDFAEQMLFDSVTTRLERARYLIRRFGKQVDASALKQLAVPDEGWEPTQKLKLAAGFAGYFMSLEDFANAQLYARQVADSEAGQSNLSIHLSLFELAFRSGDLTAMTQSLERVKQIEGTGPLWRVGEAIRLSVEAKCLKDAQIAEKEQLYAKAIEQLAEAAVERPSWPRVPRLKGDIYYGQGRQDLAVEAYLQALALGEQNAELVSRTIFLLFEKGRFVEADEVVRKLQEQKAPFSSELTRVASQVSLELENFDRALSLANDWATHSDQQEDHLWLAHIYSISRNYEQAEQEFRIAIEKDRSEPGPWVSLIQMFAHLGDTEAARQVIEQAAEEIRPERRDDALAQAYQSIKDLEKAKQFYTQALAQQPNDTALMRRFADFCLSTGQQQLAEPVLVALIADKSGASQLDQAWARRSLALLFGFRDGDEMFAKAKGLLDVNAKKLGITSEDQRALAVILSTRSDAQSLSDAIESLEQLAKSEPKFSLADNYLLASLYQRLGDWPRYSRTMRSVLGNGGAAETQYVRSYAEALVKQGELEEGQLWFNRLKKLAPQELSTATVEAQLLFRSRDYARLIKLLAATGKEPERILWAAETAEAGGRDLQQAGDVDHAQQFFQLAQTFYAEIASKDATRSLALAAYHARRGQVSQSLKLLEGSDIPVEEIGQLVQGALQNGNVQPTDARKLISVVDVVSKKHPAEISLHMAVGDLWSWCGDARAAAAAYQRVLQVNPSYIPALNNMAMALALTGQQLVEANRAVDQAVSIAGPTDYLLDTRGIVRLASGHTDKAEQDFRKALEVAPRADRHFHLAQVLAAQNRLEESRAAMQRSREAGVTADDFHPLERKAFELLANQN